LGTQNRRQVRELTQSVGEVCNLNSVPPGWSAMSARKQVRALLNEHGLLEFTSYNRLAPRQEGTLRRQVRSESEGLYEAGLSNRPCGIGLPETLQRSIKTMDLSSSRMLGLWSRGHLANPWAASF